jgi:hypothetical protein
MSWFCRAVWDETSIFGIYVLWRLINWKFYIDVASNGRMERYGMKEHAEGTLPTLASTSLGNSQHAWHDRRFLDTELSPRSREFQTVALTTLPWCWVAGHSLHPRLRRTIICSRLSEMIKCKFIAIVIKTSVALVRKRTMPTEGPPLIGEVDANFSG